MKRSIIMSILVWCLLSSISVIPQALGGMMGSGGGGCGGGGGGCGGGGGGSGGVIDPPVGGVLTDPVELPNISTTPGWPNLIWKPESLPSISTARWLIS